MSPSSYRSADGQIDRLPALVADLIRRPVDVIVANTPPASGRQGRDHDGPDRVRQRQRSGQGRPRRQPRRPGGNVTGVVFFSSTFAAKRLELLRQLVPKPTTIGVLVNPGNPVIGSGAQRRAGRGASDRPATHLARCQQRTRDRARFRDVHPTRRRCAAGGVSPVHKLPPRTHRRAGGSPSAAGGLCGGRGGCGRRPDELRDQHSRAYRQVGVYAGQILKGEKPGDLPVMRAAKFEFVLNLKTAKALGLEMPPTLLALADEVIE